MDILKKRTEQMTLEEAAEFLQANPEVLNSFENFYQKKVEEIEAEGVDNLFAISAKHAAKTVIKPVLEQGQDIIDRIVRELIDDTTVYIFDKTGARIEKFTAGEPYIPVTKEELDKIPPEHRPQITRNLCHRDIGEKPSYPEVLSVYKIFLENKGTLKGKQAYDIFRQGLDILDLDGIIYEIIGTNPNSMGNWLPLVAEDAVDAGLLVPETRIIKVPLTILQLTRMDYFSLTPETVEIVNRYCKEVFQLNPDKDYFVKTGTYSSKFDFRNAKITDPKEVEEIGSYLLFIHWQALCHAHYDLSGRSHPIYGMSTTNEWVVREFIPDVEGNTEIYHGLPLRTEYRVFVDFDTKEVLGIHAYWDADIMKKRFAAPSIDPDAKVHSLHDFVTYSANESVLYDRYEKNKEKVMDAVQRMLLKNPSLSGQWSVDVMQNGEDFYLIDMAIAENSAFYDQSVPLEKRRRSEENWLPDFGYTKNIQSSVPEKEDR